MSCCGKAAERVAFVAHGVAGLAQAGAVAAASSVGVQLQIAADKATVKKRWDACRTCEHATRSQKRRFASGNGLTRLSKCQLCKCFIEAKSLLAAETCPDGRWPSA